MPVTLQAIDRAILRKANPRRFMAGPPNKPQQKFTIEVSALGGILPPKPQPMPAQPQMPPGGGMPGGAPGGEQPAGPMPAQKGLTGASDATHTALLAYMDELAEAKSLPEGSDEREQAEQRADMLWSMIHGEHGGDSEADSEEQPGDAELKGAMSRVPSSLTHCCFMATSIPGGPQPKAPVAPVAPIAPKAPIAPVAPAAPVTNPGQAHKDAIAERAKKIQASLPPVPRGHTRMWRGNRRTDKVGAANRYSDSLEGISLPFRDGYGGYLTYLDVPTDHAHKYVSPGEPNAYFFPDHIAKSAKIADHFGDPVVPEEYKERVDSPNTPKGWGGMSSANTIDSGVTRFFFMEMAPQQEGGYSEWTRHEGPRGGQGWKNNRTGRILYTKSPTPPGHMRRQREQSASRAHSISERVLAHYNAPQEEHAPSEEELQELATHLPKLSVDQLRNTRNRLAASFGGGKRKEQMVTALRKHVADLVATRQQSSGGRLFQNHPGRDAVAEQDAAAAAQKNAARKAKRIQPGVQPTGGEIGMMNVGDIKVDPERFQFKQNVDKSGVTDKFKDVKKFDPELAGIISVWKDPQDGNTYVVNGHHRVEMAARLGHPNLAVRYLKAGSAEQARAKGALINIAEGNGTPVDAAKFMRDRKLGVEDLKKEGVSIKGDLAEKAIALKGLSDALFSRAARGQIDTDRAIAIGKHLPERHDLQNQLINHIDKKEESTGREWSPKMVAEAARMMANTKKKPKKEGDESGGLFGTPEEEDYLEERAALTAHVRGQLNKSKRDFEAVSSDRRAGAVSDAGNILNTEENKKLAKQHAQHNEIFDRSASYRGPVADLIQKAAEEYADAPKPKRQAIESSLTDSVRKLLAGGPEAVRPTDDGTDDGPGMAQANDGGTPGGGALAAERGELSRGSGDATTGRQAEPVSADEARNGLAALANPGSEHGEVGDAKMAVNPLAQAKNIPVDYKHIEELLKQGKFSEEDVPVSGLVSDQSKIHRGGVEKYLENPMSPSDTAKDGDHAKDKPVVLRHQGKDYVYDGNHRAVAAHLRGISHLPAKVINLDKPAGTEAPNGQAQAGAQATPTPGQTTQEGQKTPVSAKDPNAKPGEPPPKDLPITLMYGGSFSPIHEGHLDTGVMRAKKHLEDQGYKVGKVVIAPSADKLLKAKLGDDLIPLAERTEMVRKAIAGRPGLEASSGPGEEAENFQGKLKRVQLADWAAANYPGSRIVNVTGADAAPGKPRSTDKPALYAGDAGSSHEGYYYAEMPRELDDPNGISSGKIRKAMASGQPLPAGWMHPDVEAHYRDYMKKKAESSKTPESKPWDPVAEKDFERMPGLSPEDQQTELEGHRHARANYDALKKEYLSRKGNSVPDGKGGHHSITLNTDEWRSLIPGYIGTNSQATHEPSSYLNNRLTEEAMKAQRGKGNNNFHVLAGGGGSGKGTVGPQFINMAETPIVLDQVSDDFGKLQKKLEKAKSEHGYNPTYTFVDRKPEDALHGIAQRAINLGQRNQIARTVPISRGLESNIKARKVALQMLMLRPDIPADVIDSGTGEKGERRLITDRNEAIAHLQKRIADDEAQVQGGLADKVKAAIVKRHESGEMSAQILKGLLGDKEFDEYQNSKLKNANGEVQSGQGANANDKTGIPRPESVPADNSAGAPVRPTGSTGQPQLAGTPRDGGGQGTDVGQTTGPIQGTPAEASGSSVSGIGPDGWMPIHKRPVRIPSQQAKPVEPTAPSQPGQVKAADHSDIGKWWESLSPEDKKKAAANVPKPEGNGIRARWHEKFTSNPESAAWHDSTMTSLIAQAHDMSDGLADGKGPIDASSTTTGQAASTAPSSAESKDLYPSERWGGVKGQQSGEPKKYTFPESGQVTAKNLTMPLNFPAAGEKSVEHTGPNGQKVRAWTGPSGYRYVGVKSGNLPEAKFEAPPEGGPNSDKFSRIMPGSDGPVKHKRDAEFRPVEDTKEPDNKGFNPPEPVSPEIEQMNAAKSYAAQLHGHWMGQMHEDPETVANHMRHYQSAMDEINKLPEGVKRAVLSHAKSMSGGWDHQNPSSSKPSGHRLKFSSPPSGDVLNKLKQAGFVYDPKTRQWHGTKHEMKLLGGVPRGATDFGGADPAHLKKSRNFDASSADYNPDIAKPATPPPLPVDRQLEAARKHVAKHFNDVKSIDRELKLIRQGKDMAYDSAMNDGGKSIKAAETMEQALQEHRDKLSQQSESPPGGKSPKAPAPGSGASLKALVAELNPQGGMASGHQQARAKAEAFVRDQLQPLPKDQVYRAMQEAGIEGVRPGDSKEAMLHRAQASILAGVRAWERTQA